MVLCAIAVGSRVQDVLVLGTSALQPGSIVDIRPLGYMVMGESP